MAQPSIPKGTRDFGPEVMIRRNFIFDTIRSVFAKYGYQPLETPSMENLDTLTGKYGEEGDQLIFKVLNNGDFLKDTNDKALLARDVKKLSFAWCDRALRYDLTVPFARYVAMNKNEIAFPFRRYQIQPVWRADRPQKGRYREFYQCDADVVGSDSLINEFEFIQIFDEVFNALGVRVDIRINNRKILAAVADICGKSEQLTDMTVAIDKLDKIGIDGVVNELIQRGFDNGSIQVIRDLFQSDSDAQETFDRMERLVGQHPEGRKGIDELKTIFNLLGNVPLQTATLTIDLTLARGLNYYTGAIFEVKAKDAAIGSICGGGRYDNLTGIFGLPGISGVGISFGADRIYDVMNELQLFPPNLAASTRVLLIRFGEDELPHALRLISALRKHGIAAEIYPDEAKMKKQFKYADDRKIPWVILLGSDEIASDKATLRNMSSGEQRTLSREELIQFLQS
jgi:histidyl-tRNA synthetase